MFRLFRKHRDAVKKWLLVFFLSVVSVGMIITLAPIPTDTGQLDVNILAEISGTSITTQDLSRSIQSRLRNSPLANDPQFISRMAGIVLDDMVLRRALWDEGKKLGIEVPNEELGQNLRTQMPFLYTDGKFVGYDRYRDIVAQQTGMTVPEFEAQLREGLLLEKVRAVVTDGARVSPAEVRDEFLRRNAKARIEYVLFEPNKFTSAVEATPQALDAFFQKDPQRYKVAEQRRVRYVLIDPDRVRAEVKLGEEELKQQYSRHLSDYRVDERVRVAHILFKTEGKNPDEIATLEKTARDALAQVKSGVDFGDLAKKYSEDASAAQGGEIGWIGRGQTVKEFETAAFTMKPGEVSDLIKTTYGFHIVKLLEKQGAHLQAFEEVKEQIREQLLKQKLSDAQQTLAANLERQLRQNPKDFAAVARKFGFEARETPLFRYNQAVADFGTSESFHNLAFQLREGEVGVPITVPKGTAIFQAVEIVPEHLPKLEAVRAPVEQGFRAARAQGLAAEKAREFAQKARSGDFKALARAAALTVRESNDFAQQDYIEGLASGSQLAAAFALAPGQTSEPIPVGTNTVVFRVVAHTPANEADLPAQQEQLAEELLARKRNLAWEIYRQSLKERLRSSGALKINDAAMKQFLSAYERQRS